MIIGIIIFFLLSGYFGEPGTQAVTQEECTIELNTKEDIVICEAYGCHIQYEIRPDTLQIPSLGWPLQHFIDLGIWLAGFIVDYPDVIICKAVVDTNKYVIEDSSANANYACASGKAALVKDAVWSDNDVYKCIENIGGSACKSWERSIAKILDGIWKGNNMDDCTTKAYLVIGAGVMIALAVI